MNNMQSIDLKRRDKMRHPTIFLTITFLMFAFLLTGITNAEEAAISADKIHPLLVGSTVPSLMLHTVENESYDLTSAMAKKPTVLIFYRGSWCPYCNLHFSELQEIESELVEIGYQIIAVSPDKPENLNQSLEKHEMKYQLLSDSKMEAAKAFGIAFKVDSPTLKKYEKYGIDLEVASGEEHNLLPVPAVFLINTDGIIQFHYVNPNYSVRLKKEVILAAAKAFL